MAKKLKAGDKIVFHNSKFNRELQGIVALRDVTLGKLYTVREAKEFSNKPYPYVLDNAGDENSSAITEGKYTKIVD